MPMMHVHGEHSRRGPTYFPLHTYNQLTSDTDRYVGYMTVTLVT